MYVDPDGEWVILALGAAIGLIRGLQIGIARGETGWGLFSYALTGATVGFIGAGIGVVVGGVIAPAVGGASFVTGIVGKGIAGYIGAGVGGAIGGGAAHLYTSYHYHLMAGYSREEALKGALSNLGFAMVTSALVSMATHGLGEYLQKKGMDGVEKEFIKRRQAEVKKISTKFMREAPPETVSKIVEAREIAPYKKPSFPPISKVPQTIEMEPMIIEGFPELEFMTTPPGDIVIYEPGVVYPPGVIVIHPPVP
jgi:hypothetical protein